MWVLVCWWFFIPTYWWSLKITNRQYQLTSTNQQCLHQTPTSKPYIKSFFWEGGLGASLPRGTALQDVNDELLDIEAADGPDDGPASKVDGDEKISRWDPCFSWGLSYICIYMYIYIYILCMYQICVYDPGYILYIVRSTVIVFVYLYAYT